MKRVLGIALFAVLLVFVHSTALAQGRPSGIRVTVTNLDLPTLTADFDVTLNTSSVYGNPTLTAPTGLLGDYIFTTFYATTYPPGFTGTLLSPAVVAIDHGDTAGTGNIVTRATIAPDGPGSYRGSFSYTYPAIGAYTIEASAASMLGLGTTMVTVTTGSTITNPNQYPTGGGNSFLGSWVGRSFFGGSLTYNLVGPTANPPFQWGVRNQTPPSGAGAVDFNALQSVTAIPTASEVGLFLLALMVGGAAIFLLRRS